MRQMHQRGGTWEKMDEEAQTAEQLIRDHWEKRVSSDAWTTEERGTEWIRKASGQDDLISQRKCCITGDAT